MSLKERVLELKRDLLNPSGPQISTMNNYNFAILQYDPEEEFAMRKQVHLLVESLKGKGWQVKNIDLMALMLKRMSAEGEESINMVIDGEKRLFARRKKFERSLKYLSQTIAPDIEGPEGLAQDIIQEIATLNQQSPEGTQQLILLSRAGALYPFYRTSGLLRFLDGKTGHTPVILLYPGSRPGVTSLSFMAEFDADSDYRPRIY